MKTEVQIEDLPLNDVSRSDKQTSRDQSNKDKEIEQKGEQEMVPFSKLLQFASPTDKALMALGLFAAFANGAALPMFSLIFGNMTDAFKPDTTPDEVISTAGTNSIWFVLVGLGTMLMSFTMFSTWMITGERQAIEFRKNYFSKILSQEIGWFDTINPNELASKVANETFDIQGAIGEKVPTFIMTFSMTFFGFVIGFTRGWQLALVITATLPIMSIAAALMTVVIQNEQQATAKGYQSAGASAEQALGAIKTVKMLDGEDFECQNYLKHLGEAAKVTVKFGVFTGVAMGFVWCVMILAYALGFWYGSKLISDETPNDNQGRAYTAGDVLTIFFAILTGGFSLGQAGPCIQNFAKGKVAAVQVFKILDRQPKIFSPLIPKHINADDFKGDVIFQDVVFSYPNNTNLQILKGIDIHIPNGKKVALVGESGCGKSTIMQLIERFYDCEQGNILVDGINIKDLDLNDLRGQIGYVGQEPVLFATSIRENLLYGKKTATEEEMIFALRQANAWSFVQNLDKGLDTYVGIGGGQISGGQKQRIAIARALLKKPKILLLDEATSALDRANELQIQNTLDEVSKGITTIVIAHRLKTIQNSDLIYVIDQGKCVEKGNHDELINAHGKYEALAKNQFQAQNQNDDEQLVNMEQVIQNPTNIKMNEVQIEQKSNVAYPLQNQGEIIPKFIEESSKLKQSQLQRQGSQISENKTRKVQIQDSEVQQQINIEKDPKQNQNGFINYQQFIILKQEKLEEQKKKQLEDQLMSRLFGYSKDQRLFFYIGIISAMANGCVFPIFSLFLSEMINVLSQLNPTYYIGSDKDAQIDSVRSQANMIAIWFIIIGLGFNNNLQIIQILAALICWTVQISCLTIVAEKLTLQVRQDTFRKLIRMPISYFDEPKNNAGTLTSRLSVDAKLINSLTSTTIGINLMNFSSLLCGMTIAFVASWSLTLVSLGLSPLVFIGGLLQVKFMQGFSDKNDSAYKDSSNLIMEAVCNIRTVQSFGNQDIIMGIYQKKVAEPMDRARKKGVHSGLAFGFSQMQMFLIYAVVFYVGALLHKYQDLTVENMFKSIFGIMFATFGMGNNQHFAGDIGAAKNAAKNLFEILDSKDEFQLNDERGGKNLKLQLKGKIEFKDVSFKYITREKNLFDNLNLIIPEGCKVAFVGPSGCGKSTITQLLLRFYEPNGGEILVDGINILDYDIKELRKQFAIVSQEPVLFNCTIKENIIYNEKNVTDEQINEAAKKANALEFILKNQFDNVQGQIHDQEQGKGFDKQGQGFNKQVGSKGNQISGGQKQRIAIARAILRNSNVLLLDEATSALDSANEVLVQESLNRLMENKTTIAIAHRISTIKDSKIIYVFENGIIMEQGTYQELMDKKDFFFRLEQGIHKNENNNIKV